MHLRKNLWDLRYHPDDNDVAQQTPALGQKQKSHAAVQEPAFPPKADICRRGIMSIFDAS